MRALLLAALASVSMVATGCVGSLDTTMPGGGGGGSVGGGGGGGGGTGSGSDQPAPPPGSTPGGQASDTARIAFNTNVYPIISAKCTTGACHMVGNLGPNAPGFVDPTTPNQDPNKAWMTATSPALGLLGNYDTSALILHEGNNAGHFANYSTSEVATITNWLTLEGQWRNAQTGSGSGSGTTVDLMKQWSGCLTKTDFDTAQMATAWATQVNTSEGQCKQCHVNGTGNMMATPQDQYMFNAISMYRAYEMTFFQVDTTQNKVVMNTTAFETAYDGGLDGEHPRNWTGGAPTPDNTNNAGIQALTQWYQLASQKLANNQCTTPSLTD